MRRSGPSYFAQRSHVSFTVILILPDPVGSSHDPYSRCQHVASVDWSRVNTVGHTRLPKINRTDNTVMVGLAFTSCEDFLLPHNHNLPTRAKNSLFAARSPNQPTGCSKFTFLIFSSATRREVPLLLLLLLLILLLPSSTHSLSEEPFALLPLFYTTPSFT